MNHYLIETYSPRGRFRFGPVAAPDGIAALQEHARHYISSDFYSNARRYDGKGFHDQAHSQMDPRTGRTGAQALRVGYEPKESSK